MSPVDSVYYLIKLLSYFPKDKLAVAYTSNGSRYPTNDVVMGALSTYYNKPFTIPEFKTITLTTADLDKYIGKYSSTQMPLKVTVTKNGTTLFVQATGQNAFPVDPKGDNKFSIAVAGVNIEFEPAKKTFTLNQAGKTYLFTKTD